MSLDISYEDLRRIAVRIAGEAAALLRDYACHEPYIKRLQGESIVADRISEEYILNALASEGFKLSGISEEKGPISISGGSNLRVIIDPLDGSTNYSLCIPWASVSIAFSIGGRLRDVVAGAVAPLFHGYIFSFARGKGCYYGGRRIEKNDINHDFNEKTIVIYFNEEKSKSIIQVIDKLREDFGSLKARSLGSSALELCYVAIGKFLAFIDLRDRLRNVDVAAALGFLREIGGEAYSITGEVLDSSLESVVNLNGVIASRDPRIALKIVKVIE